MTDWLLIISCGLITYLTRFSMIAILKKEMFNNKIRDILSYVPSAIFPAIIFPAILGITYHMLNGIRHMFWDLGFLISNKQASISGFIIIALSFFLRFLMLHIFGLI